MSKYKKALILITLLLQVGSKELKGSDRWIEIPWAFYWWDHQFSPLVAGEDRGCQLRYSELPRHAGVHQPGAYPSVWGYCSVFLNLGALHLWDHTRSQYFEEGRMKAHSLEERNTQSQSWGWSHPSLLKPQWCPSPDTGIHIPCTQGQVAVNILHPVILQ